MAYEGHVSDLSSEISRIREIQAENQRSKEAASSLPAKPGKVSERRMFEWDPNA